MEKHTEETAGMKRPEREREREREREIRCFRSPRLSSPLLSLKSNEQKGGEEAVMTFRSADV